MTAITQLTREYIAVNSEGYRIGSSHHNCKISDQTIDAIRDLNEEGLGYGTLSTIFNLPRGTIAKICKYQIRGQTPDRYKTVYKIRTAYRET
tara:strand:- start:319 stop:594 length:276 start_codon:yes stop_codon:yes gene_type:complete